MVDRAAPQDGRNRAASIEELGHDLRNALTVVHHHIDGLRDDIGGLEHTGLDVDTIVAGLTRLGGSVARCEAMIDHAVASASAPANRPRREGVCPQVG